MPNFYQVFQNAYFSEHMSISCSWKSLSLLLFSEGYSESSQTSRIDFFTKRVNSWKLLTICAKSSILNVRVRTEYASSFDCWIDVKLLKNNQLIKYNFFYFLIFEETAHCVRRVPIRSYSSPYFPSFGRNTER